MTTLQEAISNGRGVERAFHCEQHDNKNTPAASVNVSLGVWVCYSCGAAGRTNGKVSRAADVLALSQNMLKEAQPETVMSPMWLDLFDAHHPSPYWVDRFDFATAELYRCGTDPASGNPTYPVRNIDNKILGVVQRTRSTPKYLYPAGVSISRCLFGWEFKDMNLQTVYPLILVEGATDVFAIHHRLRGFAFGVYGAGLKQPQVAMVKRASRSTGKPVMLAFDNDKAGRRATEESVSLLESVGVRAYKWPWDKFPGFKDIAEILAVEACVPDVHEVLSEVTYMFDYNTRRGHR